MALKLSDLNTVQEWARQNKWNARFKTGDGIEGFGSGATSWIPAVNVTTPIFNISSYDWSSGHHTFALPKAMDYPDISMTLLDDDERHVKKYLRTWFENAFPATGGIQYLSEIVKVLEIQELRIDNSVVETESYIVFPTGSTANTLTSDDAITSYTVNFKVAGLYRN